jgi:hypothetical protein
MLSAGENVLPARGMQSIPQQIADSLPTDRIKLKHAVTQVERRAVTLSSGEKVEGAAVVTVANPSLRARLATRLAIGFLSAFFGVVFQFGHFAQLCASKSDHPAQGLEAGPLTTFSQ